jgi:two-component system cell cycle sensor histidine kinase/response regulator CckA
MAIPLRTLIVEDSAIDAELLVIALRSAGYDPAWTRVDTEPQFREALHRELDIIFSDFSMPQFSAFRVLQLLRETHPEVPCIIVSGTIGEEQVVETLKSGAIDYVLKDRLDRLSLVVRRARREAQERAKRRRAEIALQAAQEKLNRLLAHSPAVIYSLKFETDAPRAVWVSENVRQLLGYDPETACSREWWTRHVHPEDRRLAVDDDSRLRALGHAIREYRFQHKDGTYRWISDEQRLVRDVHGEANEVVGVWTDITDRKSLEAQLRQAQKLESIGQLAGGVAHDFNNILTVIQGHASLLLAQRETTEFTQESAQQIALASERAAALTRQLLTFSRKQVMQAKVIDLNEVVGNVIKMLKRVLREDVSLLVNYGSNRPMVHADPGMVEQVLMNLAVNARDAMPRGGELTIATANEHIDAEYVSLHGQGSPGEYICLSVTDTGSGISPEVMPRIFEPFFTTKPVGHGTGLGLATVYGIIHQHLGWITVSSELNRGTVFRVYLPMVLEAERGAAEPVRDRTIPGGHETILLVEDEDAVRTLARNVLERKGYKVIEANSAVEALKNWGQLETKVDLVLTDMVMPGGMTGLDLIKKLHLEQPALPAIFTSGYSVEIVGKEFDLRDGINFLQKPYGPRRLEQTVRDALDHKRTSGN